ncbi:MAG: DNA repair protein RecO [Pedosphaera sp.]|nr:DNA repair protein RecO [Pedosphaera sp.]
MDERAAGIILRTRPLTETSLIIHWLTPELGRISTVAKGARRPKSLFRGKLDLFHAADFSFARSRRSDLHTLREVSLRATHEILRRDLAKLQQAAYCATLIEQATETETPLPEIHAIFSDLLGHLARHPTCTHVVFAFELKLLAELGLEPVFTEVGVGTRQLLQRLLADSWPDIGQLNPQATELDGARRFLHGFLIYHLGRIPGGRHAAIHSTD